MKRPVSLLSGYSGAWAEVTAIKARLGSGRGSYLWKLISLAKRDFLSGG